MESIGKFLTASWVAVVTVIFYFKRSELGELSLNEWGDFLAGITAPIAFLWLIIGYLLQKKELENNTHALQLQAEEMAETSEHHREAVALQKIELAHQYTISLDVTTVGMERLKEDSSVLMGLTILNNGRERRNLVVRTYPDIGLTTVIESDVFQANEGRRYFWISKSVNELPPRFIVEVSYTDVEYLHQGLSYFTIQRTGSKSEYGITRGKYS
ncbi:hypothetical protein [Vibrio sp. L85]|uniref:hypothetical protein n=1 Tax=Vibrio sp. L85 TaxID=1769292 RepID=UPI0009A38063|nr:hypothetical protein [Vibrio sp. L85]